MKKFILTLFILLAGSIACTRTSIPVTPNFSMGTPTSGKITNLQEGYEIAKTIASENLPGSYLFRASSFYSVYESQAILESIDYEFANGKSNPEYFEVDLKTSGDIEHTQTNLYDHEILAQLGTFPLESMQISEANALDIGWEELGSKLEKICGPLTSIYLEGYNHESGFPQWIIHYRYGFDVGQLTLNGNTGKVIEVVNWAESDCAPLTQP